jgi:hypothetical protein
MAAVRRETVRSWGVGCRAASLARGRCRVRAADAGRSSPLPRGQWRPAITLRSAPRHANSGRDPSSVPGILSPGKFSASIGRTGQSEADRSLLP